MGLASLLSGQGSFLTLLITTPISALLLYSDVAEVRLSGSFEVFVVSNRPTIQLVVQLLATLFSVLQTVVLGRLVNYAVRRRLASNSMTLDAIRFWLDFMSAKMNWELPIHFLLPLALFVSLTMVLSATWAAALTPYSLWDEQQATIKVPSWDNVTLIREYPTEYVAQGPALRNAKGLFAYSVGIQFLGTLLAAASSATSIDGSPRIHAKMDKSKFSYIGRSYGVASSVGLVDDAFDTHHLALGYAYQETGYMANTQCLYNETSAFILSDWFDFVGLAYDATGPLPDSDDGDEHSMYVGYSNESIVAIGVAHFGGKMTLMHDFPPRKYLSIASGSHYGFLDKIQCSIEFVPTLFDIQVHMDGRNITVTPTKHTHPKDMDPTRRLKGTVLRQYELIANDETNLYISMVGSAFNSSITDLRTFLQQSGTAHSLTDSEIILQGVENAVTVMADDMLEAYAAAQLMVGQFHQSTTAQVRVAATAFGQAIYSYAVFFLNLAIILCLLIEVVRTRGWENLPDFDIADVRQLIIATSDRGQNLADMALSIGMRKGDLQIYYDGSKDRKFMIHLGGEVIEKKDDDYQKSLDGQGGLAGCKSHARLHERRFI